MGNLLQELEFGHISHGSKDHIRIEHFGKQHTFSQSDFRISESEVIKCIKKLKSKKSRGIDRISNEMIKYSQHALLQVILKLFNMIYTSSKYPTSWAEGYIVPIFKKDNPLDPSNYRGIVILNCLGKLFHTIMNERMHTILEEKKIISRNQIGFKKQSRTSDHMFVLKAITDKYFNENKKVYSCFVDRHKAFDKVSHYYLLYKMQKSGINGNLYKIIKDMYVNVKSKLSVKCGDYLSDSFTSQIGVRQGDVLSPLLFNLYINDLVTMFNHDCNPVKLNDQSVNCLLYADDIVLLSESQDGLQNSLDILDTFCKKWKLHININKTKTMVFNKPGRKTKATFNIGGIDIENVTNYKYLGLVFNAAGKFGIAKKDLKQRANKAMFKLLKTFKGANPNYRTYMHLFDRVVAPILLYASDLWAGYINFKDKELYNTLNKEIIEECHMKYCRIVLGVNKKAPNIGIYGETGRFPLSLKAVCNFIKFWHRSANIDNNTLLHHAYVKNCHRTDVNSWVNNVEKMLNKLNLSLPEAKELNILKITRNLSVSLKNEYVLKWKDTLFHDIWSKGYDNKL